MIVDGSSDFRPRVALGELATVQGGLQVNSGKAEQPIQAPYLRVANVKRGHLDLGEIKHIALNERELERTRLVEGDLLVVEGHGNKDEVGRVALWSGEIDPCVHQNHLIRVRCDRTRLLPHYAEAYLNSPVGRRHLLRSANTTSGLNTISTGHVRKVPIPLPSIDVQMRIADVLGAAEALRARRLEALAKHDVLLEAIFTDLFGDLTLNNRACDLRSIGDLVLRFESGKSVAAGPDDAPGGLRVLKVSAVTSTVYLPGESKPVPADYSPPTSHLVRRGDLLFSRANTTELVGACALVHETPAQILLPDKLWRFVWRDPSTIEPLYVWKALQSRRARRDIGHLATGSSGSMKNISQKNFMTMRLPVPPLELQREFVERADAAREAKALAVQGLATLDKLYGSLQQQAFRGDR